MMNTRPALRPVIPENSKLVIPLLVWAIHLTLAFLTVLSV
ncbi:hypothetical protein B0G77_4742 [Paraburkholderia sp. BL10I2N1]|nr:hypothetical protein B0G77_4742 [Paraburkholderia sp. BL10I2N1]